MTYRLISAADCLIDFSRLFEITRKQGANRMNQIQEEAQSEGNATPSPDLVKKLAPYCQHDQLRGVLELIITCVAFVALWAAAWWALSISYLLTLAISIPAGAFLVRLFLIKHDCGHGAFFRNRAANNWLGRILGVVTLTPYQVWRHSHALHHATTGNLDRRGAGDIDTLTVREYRALSRGGRIAYHLYRNPLVMFVVGPAYHFLLRNRLPLRLRSADRRYWISAMGTNLSIALIAGTMIYFLGAGPFLLVQLPITLFAASLGVWMFYIQHQFEDTYWAKTGEWASPDAALYGSSHYDLPGILRWLTAYIGMHQIHHLNARIPFYRLPQVLRDFPELARIRHITLMQSLKCVKLRLWDESQRKLISFAEANALPAE
jgi:omega-6 fatty acid desaturase (delta-12 desaturase)